MVSSISGVTRPIILESFSILVKLGKEIRRTHKLHIQVADVVIEIAFERIERLKISDGRTQPIGADFIC